MPPPYPFAATVRRRRGSPDEPWRLTSFGSERKERFFETDREAMSFAESELGRALSWRSPGDDPDLWICDDAPFEVRRIA